MTKKWTDYRDKADRLRTLLVRASVVLAQTRAAPELLYTIDHELKETI
jgi:hypothetical protein